MHVRPEDERTKTNGKWATAHTFTVQHHSPTIQLNTRHAMWSLPSELNIIIHWHRSAYNCVDFHSSIYYLREIVPIPYPFRSWQILFCLTMPRMLLPFCCCSFGFTFYKWMERKRLRSFLFTIKILNEINEMRITQTKYVYTYTVILNSFKRSLRLLKQRCFVKKIRSTQLRDFLFIIVWCSILSSQMKLLSLKHGNEIKNACDGHAK